MTKRKASNLILSHRRCYGCGREEKNVCCSICPDCGHFMHPIGYVYVPAINNGDRQTVEKSDRHCCGTCYWYDGEIGDKKQFCDELEVYVDEKFCCSKWKKKC